MKFYITLFLLLFDVAPFALYGQSVELSGRVGSNADVENIHVMNKTQQLFTITSKEGLFTIQVQLNDTIAFSSIQHQPKEVVVTQEIFDSKVVYVALQEQINELDEVVVGKVLTGNLLMDIENADGNVPINFYDVGIPGYMGKIPTQSERRLSQAGEFKPKQLLGVLVGGMSLDPLINTISGRTKKLKKRVDVEEREALMLRIKSRLAKDFFMSNPLDDDLKMDFFYFCADDKNFVKYCKNETDFNILLFLRMKYKQYKANLDSNED